MSTAKGKLLTAILAVSIIATLVAGLRTVLTPEYAHPSKADRVVVVGVPSLDWETITPENMPQLWQTAQDGSVGMMTTRAARSVTCPWDGWVTLGAGNRARYPATIPEDELPPEPDTPLPGEPVTTPEPTPEPTTPEEQRQEEATEGCLGQRGAVPTVGGSKLGPAITENAEVTFGAEPGALGTAVSCSTVVGGSPLLAVDADGADVRSVGSASTPEQWADLIGGCPLTLVATGHALNRSVVQLQALDSAISEIVQGAQQQGATVIVAGISQAEYVRAGLHAVIMVDPGMQQQVLSSPSTGRAPFSQLIDLAPTVLSILDEPIPASMTGQILRGQDREVPLAELTDSFHQEQIGASAHIWMSSKFFAIMAWLTALTAVLLAVLVHRGRTPTGFTRALGTVVALLPAASLIANVFPWWSVARPSIAILASMISSWVLVSLVALLGPWRRHLSGPLVAACVITFGALALDVLTGSHLQLNSPLGYNAVVAGRFTGFGNMTFAIYGAAGLVLVAVTAKLATSRAGKTAVVAICGVALIAMDGAPGAGADFGGVVALVPSLLLLWLVVTGIQLSRAKLLLVFGSGALVVMGIAFADYLRAPQDRTHLGRFVEQIFNGTAITIVQRKLEANLRVLTGSVLTILAVVLIAIIVWQWVQRSSAGHAYVAERAPYATAAVIAVATLAVLGFAVNDSGIAVTAAALAVVVPLVLGVIGTEAKRAESRSEDTPSTAQSTTGT